MSLLGPSDAAEPEADGEVGLFADINITPLTDVILVLLIIFMVSSSAMVDAVREGRLDLALPKAGSAPSAPADAPTLILGLTHEGRLFVDGAEVEEAALDAVLTATHARGPNAVVIVDADGALEHRKVVGVIDRIRAAGFSTVGIGTEAQAP